MSCSHCFGKDHNKRKCPDAHLSTEEAFAKRRKGEQAFYDVANFIADVLAAYEPEERAHLSLEAFRRSNYEHDRRRRIALMPREAAALRSLEVTIGNGRTVHVIDGGRVRGGR